MNYNYFVCIPNNSYILSYTDNNKLDFNWFVIKNILVFYSGVLSNSHCKGLITFIAFFARILLLCSGFRSCTAAV